MAQQNDSPFDSIEAAIRDIADGKLVIVTDDEARENEGDLIFAAEKVTPEAVNRMIRHARGLLCGPKLGPQLRYLGFNCIATENRETPQNDFAV